MKTSSALRVLAVAVVACCPPSVLALDPSLDASQYAHTAWNIQDSSLKAGVRSIAQTPDGYLWLGTEFGLLRFDGVRFVPWNPPPGQRLPSSNIRSLVAARDGTLWIGTLEGLASWKDGKLKTYAELAGQNVLTLLEDREGTVWAGTFQVPKGRLCAIQRGNVQCYGSDGNLGQWVWSLYEDGEGRIWAGAETGLWRWKPGPPQRYPMPHPIETSQALAEGDSRAGLLAVGEGLWQFMDEKTREYQIATPPGRLTPVNMFRDRDGGLWVGTLQRGMLHVHQGRTSVFAQSDGLSSDHILTMFEDREGNIWVGTTDGLDRFRETPVFSISVKQGLSNPSVESVLVARDNSVWLSTLDGLNHWNDGRVTIYWPGGRDAKDSARLRVTGQSGSAFYTSEKEGVTEIADPGLPDTAVGSLYEDDRGRIWVSTPKGIARFENGRFSVVKEVPGGWVNAITGDTKAGVWISYQDQGLVHWADGKLVEEVPWSRLGGNVVASSVMPDPVRGGLWLGFFQGGLVHFKDGQISASYGKKEGLGNGRVMGLQLDADGTLWAATEGGLSRIKDGRIVTLSSPNGLPCDTVHWSVEVDSSFWLYTACGLIGVARSELEKWASDPRRGIQFTVLGRSDGVRNRALLTGYTPRVSKSADGRLWFTNLESVSVMDPRHLALNKVAPPVHIEQVTADAKTYDPRAGLRLPARVRDLAIEYTALSFAAPETVRFRYKLEGQDPDWREVLNDRKVQYSNLAPRKYRFRVLASNNSGVWNEHGDTLEFSIAPAYWQTNWFRGLCAAIFLALVWAAYQLRVHRLQRESKQLRDAIDTIPGYVWSALPDGSVDFINRRWLEFSGVSLENALGQGWEAAVHPDDRAGFAGEWRKAVASGKAMESEARVRRADGQYRWLLVRNVPLRDQAGRIVKWYGTSADIDDRKRAEETLREQANLLDLTHDTIFVADMQGVIKYWNRGAEEQYGWTAEQAVGTLAHELLKTVFPTSREEVIAEVTRAGRWEGELLHTRKDGTPIVVACRLALQSDEQGAPLAILESNNDITDRKRAEEERERVRQLEADLAHINRVSMMGELAASIAHEVNQPLSGVVSNGSACLRWLTGNPPNVDEALENARRIVRDGKRAGEIITRIRVLTKKTATSRERLDLNETIRDVLALFGDEAKKKSVNIQTRFADDLSPVSGDRVQLQQVMLNLIMNGIEAMSSVADRVRELVITTRNMDPDQVQVTVEDSGIGIDAQTTDRIFDSFYTTKPSGMGMGLSISRSILQAHGGRIWATAKDGTGAIFHLTLPTYHKGESHAGVA